MAYVHRARPLPVVSVHRDTLLNDSLSPTARLLYAVLLAAVEADVSIDQVARLAGVEHARALPPFLEELVRDGLAAYGEHQDGHLAVTVHEMPVPAVDSGVSWHACVPCEDCGACTCFGSITGVCRRCTAMRRARKHADQDIARWKTQREEGAVYSLGAHGRLLHRWDCYTLNNPEKGLELLEAYSADHLDRGGNIEWFRLPELLTVHQVRTLPKQRRSCQVCKPDPA